MKVLHLASEYPPAKVYGLGRFVHGLARAQAAQGDEVHVLTNSNGGEQDDVVLDGVGLHRIAFPNPPRPADGQGEVLQFNHGLVARYLERKERFSGVEVVNSHDWLTAIAAREIATDLGVPLVVTVHDEVVGKRFGLPVGNDRFVRELEALSVHDASRVIANSGYVAAQVSQNYGVDPAHIAAIPGGIDPNLLDVPRADRVVDFRSSLAGPNDVLVLYVGRLDPEKGLDVLAEAALILEKVCPRVRLALAGTGSLEEPLKKKLEPLRRRATFLGYVSGQRLSYLYRAADVVCVPSLYEPYGLVALEGMLAGAAVVVAKTGGLSEIVRHEEDGLLVPPGDPLLLVDAIVRLARDTDLRAQMGSAGQERAKGELSWTIIAERTREAYEEAVEQPRAVCATVPEHPALESVSLIVLADDAQAGEETRRVLLQRTDYPALEVNVLTSSDAAALNRASEETSGEYVCFLRAGLAPESSGWLRALVWLLRDQDAGSVSPRLSAKIEEPYELTSGMPVRGWHADATRCLLTRRRFFLERALPDDPDPIASWRSGLERPHWTHPVRLQPSNQPQEHLAQREVAASIVLLAHDGLADTRRALEAVLMHTQAPYELVLVDNGSGDGTRAYFHELQAAGRAPVRVIENPTNLGYAKGANQGIRAAKGEHVVLLNNDTQVQPGWLTALLDAARSAPRVGIVTAKVLNPDLTVQNAGGILHHPDGRFTVPHQGQDRLAPTVTQRQAVESASGPCMLLTRALIDRVGIFDEAYSPAYYEDSDLCMRARRAGFMLLYEPGAEVVHAAQRTSLRLVAEGKLDLDRCLSENKARFYERYGVELEADEAARRLVAVTERLPRHRILLCYGKSETTTAAYCEAALRKEHDVVVAGPGQEVDLGPRVTASELYARAGNGFDLLLCIEGENYFPQAPWVAPCPTALWAIDNHLHAREPDGWHLKLAAGFDRVFLAQRDYLSAFLERGINASWLPLACDPDVHGGKEIEKDLDVVFVGHVRPFHKRRRRLLDRLERHFNVHEVQGVFREDMSRLFSRARIVFNCSLAGDLNMRVFEALASGSLLLTDRINAGLETLFAHREHLVLYDDDTLEEEVERYLTDAKARAAIALRGQRLALAHHTYRHRMHDLLRVVRELAREEVAA